MNHPSTAEQILPIAQNPPIVRVNSQKAAHAALAAALSQKALDPVLLDVRDLCSYTEYLLVISGRSDRQVEAISTAVKHALAEHGRIPLGTEGVKASQWALLDFGDLVVHVFYHPTRTHYDLESLWVEAKKVPIEVPAEARSTADDNY